MTRLQKKLKSAGFNPGSTDGVFGLKTKHAVEAFQKSRSLAADGVVGAATGKKLFSSSNAKYWDGKSDMMTPKTPPDSSGGTSTKGEKIAHAAKSVAAGHYKYVWGGGHHPSPGASTGQASSATVADDRHTKGYDCSGFVREAVYKATGKDSMSGTAASQFQKTHHITKSQLKPGDLIFWSKGGPGSISHVAIYAGKIHGVPMMYESAPSYERHGSSYGTHLTPVSYQPPAKYYGRVK
ncbi:MAG: peptidoglycan-binding protein [Myxococcaceae bacterium]